MTKLLSPDGEYVDWRAFLLSAARPWPEPSQADLLRTLQAFRDLDPEGLDTVTQEQYESVSWLNDNGRLRHSEHNFAQDTSLKRQHSEAQGTGPPPPPPRAPSNHSAICCIAEKLYRYQRFRFPLRTKQLPGPLTLENALISTFSGWPPNRAANSKLLLTGALSPADARFNCVLPFLLVVLHTEYTKI